MSARDHSLMGSIISSLKSIEERTMPATDHDNIKVVRNRNNRINNVNELDSGKIKSKPLHQSLLTSGFLANKIPTTHGTINKPPENHYEKENPVKISYQHKLTTVRKSDKEWVGVRIYNKKPHVARLWCQNMNGISRDDAFNSFADTLIALNRYDVQFFSFTETNLNAANAYVRDSVD